MPEKITYNNGKIKLCTKCRQEKNLDEFPKLAKAKDGLFSWCKLCVNIDCGRRRHKDIAATNKYQRNKSFERRLLVLNKYGGKCKNCLESRYEFLTMDHIKEDGADHRKQLRRDGRSFMDWIIINNFPSFLQVLCANCNFIKTYISRRYGESNTRYNRYRRRLKETVLEYYSNCKPAECVCCKDNRIIILSIDHINRIGKDRKIHGGSALYQWLKTHKFPSGFRTLCLNCNNAYGRYGYCPHQATSSVSTVNVHDGPVVALHE